MASKEKEQAIKQHELVGFRECTFGDGGFYYHDGADRAICSCGWKSVAVQRDKTALVALWKIHVELAQIETECPNCKHRFVVTGDSQKETSRKKNPDLAVR